MARVEDAKGREKGSGYSRLFGDEQVGHLMSRAHAAVISSGTELERMVKDRVSLIEDLDGFLQREIMEDGVLVADKSKVKKCKSLDFEGSEPDFLVFRRREGKQTCHIVELKDGDAFDTKKSDAEYRSMHRFIQANAQHMPYVVQAHFCCFNQENKQAIINGFKRKISPNEAMTGREFCELLEIDYDEMVGSRAKFAKENLKYFINEMLKLRAVKDVL